ncbi:hypothetical protein VN12_26145 [Pirellula sp. SH-Sr6A]|nr:hypothetical protein VN12_26145 [Pirellula sp. SH-Sr6A]
MGRLQDVPGWQFFSERRLLSMVDAQCSGDSAMTYIKKGSGMRPAMSTIWLHYADLFLVVVYFLFSALFCRVRLSVIGWAVLGAKHASPVGG